MIPVGPDSTVEWDGEHVGLRCVVLRHRHRSIGGGTQRKLIRDWHCGYVRVPIGHPLHQTAYEYIENYGEVHGGLTYGHDDAWGRWFGFDCAHSGDAYFEGDPDGHWWTLNEVIAETKKLAEALSVYTHVGAP